MVVEAKPFDTQSFRTLFGLGWGGRINPSLYISVSNSLKIKAGSITGQDGRKGQMIRSAKFKNPILTGVGGKNQPFSL